MKEVTVRHVLVVLWLLGFCTFVGINVDLDVAIALFCVTLPLYWQVYIMGRL